MYVLMDKGMDAVTAEERPPRVSAGGTPVLLSKILEVGPGGARWCGPKRLDEGRGVDQGAAGRRSWAAPTGRVAELAHANRMR